MAEFIKDTEEYTKPFDLYFEENIVPLVEAENKIKEKYRSKFWGYFFTVLFLMSVNILIALFGTLMYKKTINWEQLILVNLFAFIFIFLPIYRYNKIPKNDIFDVFLKFYGNWGHLQNSQVRLVHSPIIPKHDSVGSSHNIIGKIGNASIELRDTYYTNRSTFRSFNWNKTISYGVILYITFPENFNGSMLIFERNGFYRKNIFPNYECYNDKVNIPAANYFNIFTSNNEIGNKMLHAMLFENILDLKEIFKAKHLYLQMENNYVRVYLEGSEFYIDNYKLWNKKIDKNRFWQMHREFVTTYSFVQMIQSLMETK